MVKKDGKLVPISEKDFVAFVGDKLGIEDLDVKAFISGFKKEILPRGTPRAQGKESLHSDPICDVMAFLGDIVPTTEYTAIYERKLETMKLTPVTTKGGRDGLIEFLTWAQGMSKDQPRTAALRGLSASADHAFTVTPNHPSVAFFSERTKKRITAQETESISFARMSQSPGEWKIWLDRNIFVGRAASFRRNEITLSKDCTIEEVIEEVLKKLPVEPDAKAIEKENTKRVLLLKCIRKHLLEKTGYCPIITFGDSNWITDTEMPIYFGYIFDPWLQKWGCIDIYGDEDTLRISSKDELEKIHVEIKSISWGAHELERIHLLSFDRTSSKHLQNLEDAFTAAWNSLGSFIATLSDADREQFLTFIRKPTEELLRESGCDISKKFVPKTPENWKEAFLQCIELQYRHRKIIEEVCSSPGEYRVSRVQDQYLHYLNNEMAFLEQVKNLLSGKMMDMAISPPPSPLTTPETPSPVVTPLPLSPTLEERVSPGPAEELGEPELKKPTKPSITEEKEAQAQQRADAEKTARSAAEGAPLYAEMPLATKALEAEGRALKAQAEAEATATDAQTAVVQRLEREAQARAEEIHKTVQAVATANAEAATKMLKLANTAELTAVTATNVAKEAEAMQKAEMNVLVRAPLLTGMAKKLRENAQKASNTKQEADTTLEQAKATALKARAEITSSLTRAQQFAKDARQAADKAQAPEAMRLAQLAEEASVRAEEEAGQAYKAISQFIQEAQTQAEQVAKARTEAVKAAQVTLAAKIAAVKAAEETAALSQAAESASAAQAKKAIETSVAAATQELKAAQDAALQAADAVIRAEQAVTSAQKVVFSVRRQAVATTTAFKSQKLDNEKFRTVGRNAWERVLQIQKQTEERFREISTAAGGAKAAKAEAEQWSQTAEEAVSEARKAEKPEQAVEALKKAQQATLHAQEAQSTAMQNAKSASENATMLTNEPDKAAKAENVLAAAQAYQTEVGKVLESWSNPPYIVNFSALNTCAQRVEEMIGVLNALPLKEKIQTSGMIQESHKLERALKTCNVLKRYQELKTIFDLFGGWAGNRTKAMWIDATTNELTCGPLTLFVPTHSPDGIGDAVDETLGPLLKDVEWMDKLTDGLKKGIKENLMYLKEMYPSDERIQQVTYDLINALDQALERSTRGAASEVGEQEKEGLGERAAKRKKS